MALTAAAIWLCGCISLYNPATQRNEIYFIDTKQEVAIGRNMDAEVSKKYPIIKDQQMQQRLDTIGEKIARASDRNDLQYNFKIIRDLEFNAFAIPGGFVYVNSGLIQAATDDELACVLAHEVGHIAARHSVKRLQATLGYQILINIALAATPAQMAVNKSIIAQAVDIAFNFTSLGYSRQDEFLSDKLAIKYARKAGFDPNGMVSFFEKLKIEAEKKGPQIKIPFLSSHPPVEERIKQGRKEIGLSNPK
ncbi:MAG: M48 family metallopeptidase [Candidatus Omnitrophota bacterium]